MVAGLFWAASQLEPVAFTLMKLRIIAIVEDDKVSVDDLQGLLFTSYAQKMMFLFVICYRANRSITTCAINSYPCLQQSITICILATEVVAIRDIDAWTVDIMINISLSNLYFSRSSREGLASTIFCNCFAAKACRGTIT
jgi:hypothetical protein